MCAGRSKKNAGALEVLSPGNLPFQMFLLVQQMTRRFDELLRPHRLTPLHWGVLCCLWAEDGLRTSEIALRLEQLGGTITVGLDAMQRRGLIRRRRSAGDKRVLQVFLTERGRVLRGVLEPEVRALIASNFDPLTLDEYAVLDRQVGILRQHLKGSAAVK